MNCPVGGYTAACRRDDGAWLVHVPELGRWMRAARLVDVGPGVRALAAAYGFPDAPVALDIQDADGAVHSLLEAATAARAAADQVSAEAVTARRVLARTLAAHGFAVVDVATLLGVSFTRAQLLLRRPGALDAATLALVGRLQPMAL